MLFILILICLLSLTYLYRKFFTKKRRRIYRSRTCKGRRYPWPKRPKVKRYIRCLQVLRTVLLQLMKSYGCSFGHTVSLDSLVLETLMTQKAVSAFFAAYASQMRKESYSWTISRFCRNKLAHSLHGNTLSRKGMGKGKKGAGKDIFIDEEELFRQEIKSALPEQAILRMQPVLFESDWNVPIRTSFELSSSPGIAIVMKSQVPNVLRQVGYTQNSVAMVTTQSSSQMYLRGYPRPKPGTLHSYPNQR